MNRKVHHGLNPSEVTMMMMMMMMMMMVIVVLVSC